MNKIYILFAISSFFILINPGCAQSGRNFPMERTNEIKPGVSSKDDVKRILGEPESVTRFSSGLEGWSYQHGVMVFGTLKSKSYIVVFSPNGIVQNASNTQSGTKPTTSTQNP